MNARQRKPCACRRSQGLGRHPLHCQANSLDQWAFPKAMGCIMFRFKQSHRDPGLATLSIAARSFLYGGSVPPQSVPAVGGLVFVPAPRTGSSFVWLAAYRSRASSRFPQGVVFSPVLKTRSTFRFRACVTPIRACINGPRPSAAMINTSIATKRQERLSA